MGDRHLQKYLDGINKQGSANNNPFAHAEKIMENEPGEVKNHSEVFSKQAMLGIIKDDDMLRTYQREGELLIQLYSMSLRYKKLIPFFNEKRAKFFSEISLTRAKEGEERKHQAELGGYDSPQDMRGYGNVEQPPDQNQIEQIKNFVKTLKRG